MKAKLLSLVGSPKSGWHSALYASFVWILGLTVLGIGIQHACGDIPYLERSQMANEYQIHTWTSQDGLPPGVINSLYQTRDGSLWIACQGGIARFDGSKFVVYDSINTPVLGDEPMCITEDESELLWVGTRYSGLARKLGNEFIRHPVRSKTEYVKFLHARQGGGVWAGAGRLLPLLGEGPGPHYEGFIKQPALPYAVGNDERNYLWVSFRTNLTCIAPDGKDYTQVAVPPLYEGKTVCGIAKSRSGGVWLAFVDALPSELVPSCATYLARYERGKWVRAPTKPDAWVSWGSLNMVEDRTGAVWMPYQQNTLLRFRDDQFLVVPCGSNYINEIPSAALVDRDGIFWVGTRENVLRRYVPRRIRAYTTREGLVHDDVWSVSEAADGSILIGTEGGVSRLYPDGHLQTLPMPPKQPQSNVRAIVEEVNGTIWFGTIRALHRWHNDTTDVVKFPGEWENSKIRALSAARGGGLWVGTVRGLMLYRDGKVVQNAQGECLGAEEMRAIHEARDGALWVGTHGGGLSRIQNNRRTTFTTDNGLSGKTVCSIYEDSDGTIWAGTDNGVTRIRNSTARSFREADGLLARTIHCILEDEFGRLWMSSDKGVFWLWKPELNELRDGEDVRCITYEVGDGLPARTCNGQTSHPAGCKSRDGRLWFATPGGLVVIDPKLVGPEENPPYAVIERIRANGKLVAGTTPDDVAQALETSPASSRGTNAPRLPVPNVFHQLPPGSARVLEFRYAANNLIGADKTRFRYRLVGLDDAWIDAGAQKEAYFTDINPGSYRFELVAGNHHGAWQTRPATVDFELLPFFYQTWWFYGLVGLCSVSLGASVIAWRAKELRRIHELQRLNALNEQRKRIARDIHDELGASLTHIVQLTDVRQVARDSESRTRRIATVANEAVNHINEIVWANNPEYDTLQDLVAYIREYAATFLDPTPIKVRFDFPEQVCNQSVSGLFRRGVLLIVKEALHNAVKHANANTMQLTLALSGDWLRICIEDDGDGFAPDDTRRFGNGLASMLNRTEDLGGHLEVRSTPLEGTKVILNVPLCAGGVAG